MDAATSSALRKLLAERPLAALATLHRGEPAVSMVPFVVPAGAAHVAIHVSALATHTNDMLAHRRVGLLVVDDIVAGVAPQATPRVSLQAEAEPLARDSDLYAETRAQYLARFPDASVTFELTDFSLFILRPVAARLVAGFARAYALAGDPLLNWLRASG